MLLDVLVIRANSMGCVSVNYILCCFFGHSCTGCNRTDSFVPESESVL